MIEMRDEPVRITVLNKPITNEYSGSRGEGAVHGLVYGQAPHRQLLPGIR